jgi:hypothetical protein
MESAGTAGRPGIRPPAHGGPPMNVPVDDESTDNR